MTRRAEVQTCVHTLPTIPGDPCSVDSPGPWPLSLLKELLLSVQSDTEWRGRGVQYPLLGALPRPFVWSDVRARSSGLFATKKKLLFLFLLSDDLTQQIAFCSLSEGGKHKS